MKLYLDPGHGGHDPGASRNGLVEKEVALDIALTIRSLLIQEFEDVEVKMSRSDDRTVSLTQRTTEANNWGADFFLSIHLNAFNRSAQGYEDYIHDSLDNDSQTARYQNTLHREITKVNNLTNRGQKQANFHVLRETRMSALLTENGFIDNSNDANLIKQDAWRLEVARGCVNGLASAFQLRSK